IHGDHGGDRAAVHEDALIRRGYLEAAVGFLERHRDGAWAAGELREFSVEPPAELIARGAGSPAFELFASPAAFVRGVLRGIEPMFGSVVYRRAAPVAGRAAHARHAPPPGPPHFLSLMTPGARAVLRLTLLSHRAPRHNDARH